MKIEKLFRPIPTLSKRMFHTSRGRNLVAVLAILLTTMMFTSLFTLSQSMSQNLIEMTFRQTGYNAEASMRGLSEEQADLIANHPDVEELGRSIVLGLAENRELSGRSVEIRWANDPYAQHSYALPTTGHLPQAADEIALDTLTLDRLGIPHELGAPVTLEWRKDSSDPDAETIRADFTLCGFWEGNQSSYSSMAWVSRVYADKMTGGVLSTDPNQIFGLYMVQVNLYSDQNIEEAMERVLADTGLSELEYSVNLAYSPEMGAVAAQENLPMYLGMGLVFIAGYLIIYNIFQISVTADVQFYGKLKTLGTTTRQLKKLIYNQANRLCIVGIPAGLILGWLLGTVLVPVLMGSMEGTAVVSASPIIFIGSALFAWATVLISCLRPARLAGKISPIEALRMSDADSGSKKKVKRHRGSASLSSMAWDNLWRNKKRTVTVICSLTLGLVLLSGFYAKNAAFDMEKYLADLTIADFTLSDSSSEDYLNGYDPHGTTLTGELVSAAESQQGLEAVGHQYSAQIDWQMDEATLQNVAAFYTEERLADWESYDPAGAQALRDALSSGGASATLYGLDGIPLDTITQQQYLMEGSFDAAAFASGDYILAVGPSVEPGESYPVLPTSPVGSVVELNGRSYTVMAIVYPLNPVTQLAPQQGENGKFALSFILPTAVFREQWSDHTLRQLFLNTDDSHIESMQAFLDEYMASTNPGLPVTSRQTMAEQYQAQTRSSAVMGNAVSVVIALVGVLNFINSMVTAIVSRRREFAVMQSVGMTKKQLCRMLVNEGLYYAGLTLLFSYLISAFAVGVVVRAMVEGGFTTFRFTLLPLVACTPVLIFFAVLIPYLCFRNLDKHSIVERLRSAAG